LNDGKNGRISRLFDVFQYRRVKLFCGCFHSETKAFPLEQGGTFSGIWHSMVQRTIGGTLKVHE